MNKAYKHSREEYNRRRQQGYSRNIPEERFLKLAEYEETGLTPKQIIKLIEQNTRLKELLKATAEDADELFKSCDTEYDKHDDISEPENCRFCNHYSEDGCKMSYECKWRYADEVKEVLEDD